ncbi:MAG TPA: biotin/lipoyl-containing protein [Anaerolineales bacterium]|nr:biotin/lipoyl-containing protein [Anaerolineales bacterium]
MKFSFNYNSETITIDFTPMGKSYRATVEDKTVDVQIIRASEGKLALLIDGQRVTAYVSSERTKRWVTINGQTVVLTKSSGAKRRGVGHDHASELAAPMPGQVRAINVSEGETVTKGQTLLVIEAMKMEIRIQAPFDGLISSISVKVGQTVEREQILVKMEHG